MVLEEGGGLYNPDFDDRKDLEKSSILKTLNLSKCGDGSTNDCVYVSAPRG